MNSSSQRARALAAITLLIAASASAQGSSASDSAMTLNRAGDWAAAADLARRSLASTQRGSRAETCRLRVMLAYAEMQLAHRDTANALLSKADSTCEATTAKMEMAHDLASLHQDLASRAGPRASPSADGSWATADPRNLGLDVLALERHLRICERTGADACLWCIAIRSSKSGIHHAIANRCTRCRPQSRYPPC